MYATSEEIVGAIEKMRKEKGREAKAVIVLNYELPSNIAGAELVGEFMRSIRFEERFWVYEATHGLRVTTPSTASDRPPEVESAP